MDDNRDWMYRRKIDGTWNPTFLSGLDEFIEYASSQPHYLSGDKLRCPCRKCDNIKFHNPDEVRYHIGKSGFIRDYKTWVFHGEVEVDLGAAVMDQDVNTDGNEGESSAYRTMVIEHVGPHFNVENVEESPNPEAQRIYDMLNAGEKELYPGCDTYSQLSYMTRFMSLKAENQLSERCFNQFAEFNQSSLPKGNLCPDNFYATKKLLRGLGLPVEKIDCCPNHCMLYWDLYKDTESCIFCGTSRYKDMCQVSGSRRKKRVAALKMYYFPLTPRLQRLYMSNATAADMRWHATTATLDDGIMRHPAHSPAWKHIDTTFPEFAMETRNVGLGLSTDGFAPFAQSGRQYSSWPLDARVQDLAEEQGEEADLNMIYQTVVAEKEAAKEFKKKNRMYGTDSLARSLFSTGSNSSMTSQFQASPEIQNQLTTLQQQLLEERRPREQQQALIQEQQTRFQDQQARFEEQAKQLAVIQQMLSQSKFPPPTPPVDD